MARQPLVDSVSRDASAAGDVPGRSGLGSLVVSLRPGQWTKNLVVFAGLLFGRRLFDATAAAEACAGVAIFCALSGVVYLLNGVADREADRQHPLKSTRPIASGELAPGLALATAAALAVLSLALAYWLRPAFALVALAYVLLQAAYSARLKHVVIIDVLTIAIGFVLRAVAGAVATTHAAVVHVEVRARDPRAPVGAKTSSPRVRGATLPRSAGVPAASAGAARCPNCRRPRAASHHPGPANPRRKIPAPPCRGTRAGGPSSRRDGPLRALPRGAAVRPLLQLVLALLVPAQLLLRHVRSPGWNLDGPRVGAA